jgi:hypothetical protein
MKPKRRSPGLLVAFLGLAVGGGSVSAGEPTAQELIQRTPVIDSRAGKHKSLAIGGTIKHTGIISLRFRATYEAPDRYSLVIRDGIDDTPLVLASDNRILVYDPVRPVVLYGESMSAQVCMLNEEDGLKFHLNWAWCRCEPSEIRLDIASLFDGPSGKVAVSKVTEREYLLTSTSKSKEGGSLKAYYDLGRSSPCRRFEMLEDPNGRPLLCLDEIAVDEGPVGAGFTLPARERLASKVAIREVHDDDPILKSLSTTALMLRGVYARIAANQPKLRADVEQRLPELLHIDWDRVHENDRTYSQALREIVKPKSE